MGKNLHTKLENIKNLAQNFVQKSTDSFGKKYTIFAPKIQATDTLALSFEIHMTEGEKTTKTVSKFTFTATDDNQFSYSHHHRMTSPRKSKFELIYDSADDEDADQDYIFSNADTTLFLLEMEMKSAVDFSANEDVFGGII